jgi:uncharacterized membrane protein
MKKKWHMFVFALVVILAILSWLIAFYYWGKLPQVIPTHFGLNGTANAWGHKSVWNSFMIPIIQSILLVGFIFLYIKPQYSDLPTTLLLMSLPEEKREYAFKLIRTMLVMVLLFTGLIFTYITYMMNAAALGKNVGFNPWGMTIILVLMFGWLIWWTIKVYRATRNLLAENNLKSLPKG